MSTQPSGLTFVPLAAEYLDACAAIAATAPDPWNRQNLETTIYDPHRQGFVALQNGVPAGIACFLSVADSADLEIFAVAPNLRRQNIGFALLSHSLAALQNQNIRRCLLEVRASNTPALALYARLGFETLARRPGMYHAPAEDGFLMAKTLLPG